VRAHRTAGRLGSLPGITLHHQRDRVNNAGVEEHKNTAKSGENKKNQLIK
jgi:hypothetical protein